MKASDYKIGQVYILKNKDLKGWRQPYYSQESIRRYGLTPFVVIKEASGRGNPYNVNTYPLFRSLNNLNFTYRIHPEDLIPLGKKQPKVDSEIEELFI